MKIKNARNEALFLGPEPEEKLNPYAKIIVDEARSRGISVEVLDDEEEPVVSLAHRALPLIELLEAATDANANVM